MIMGSMEAGVTLPPWGRVKRRIMDKTMLSASKIPVVVNFFVIKSLLK